MSERAAQPNPRSCDEIEELLPLYPLGVLDQEETAAVESHVAICPACAAELLRYEAVTDMLGEAVVPARPPADGRAMLLRDAMKLSQDTAVKVVSPVAAVPLAPITPITKAKTNGWKAFALVAAAVLILFAGGAAALTKSLIDERDEARQSAQALAPFIDANTTMVAMAAQPAAQTSSWDGKGVMIESKSGSMAVVVNGCPPSTEDRVYKVWIAQTDADGDPRVVLGDMTIGSDGKGWLPVSMPADMPNPQILGVSVIEGSEPLSDLFIGQLSTT
jgi:anti-sigma factor RsiW